MQVNAAHDRYLLFSHCTWLYYPVNVGTSMTNQEAPASNNQNTYLIRSYNVTTIS